MLKSEVEFVMPANTFEKLGIPEAEQKYLSGVSTQYESEVVYHNMLKEAEEKGVIFLSTDMALKLYPDLFKKYFSTVVPVADNKFSALNGAVWSGGSFIYVPKGVHLDKPLQSYFRINNEKSGQFERTLIIVDEGADVHYVEGCTAPTYSKESLHAAVVEIIVLKGGKCRYSTVQNWSTNIYGIEPAYLSVQKWEISDGRNFTNDDIKNNTKVAIIGNTVSENLFGDMNPINKTIRIGGVPFKIVGLLKNKGENGMGQDQDDTVFIPLTTAQRNIMGSEFPGTVRQIIVQAVDGDSLTQAQEEVTALLKERHNIGKNKEYFVKTLYFSKKL